MVLEIAEFAIASGREEDFTAAFQQAIPLVAATEGFREARLTQGVESPSTFVLLVEWDSVEAHTRGFRESERFARWRELIGPFFAAEPRVLHTMQVHP
jgi:heme-degrading monooxygenase HmoA